MGIITIATDFGTADGYTAAMKGVIKSIAPDAELIDVTDDLSGVLKASIVLLRYYSHFPPGTVHLVVVDPTVGSGRRAVIGAGESLLFVGPDNGLFSHIMEDRPHSKWWSIETEKLPPRKISSTFHGRDIFAPAAALLASGRSPEELGEPIDDPCRFEIPRPKIEGNVITGQIIDIDKFGNLITNINQDMLTGKPSILLEEKEKIPLVDSFSNVPKDAPLAYIGSLGFLEIAVNLGRADSHFNAERGRKVIVKL
jgi:S-adenosylmethionine hydrolase